MGIPYSKQISSAFDQVTPLVGEGFEVLQTTKNISILLAAIQVLTVILLGFILIVLLALLVTVNPDLVQQRQDLITPAVRWGCDSLFSLIVGAAIIVIGAALGGLAGVYVTTAREAKEIEAGETIHDGESVKGEDVDAIREGNAQQ